MDNQQYNLPPHRFECILAAGIKTSVSASSGQAFDQLETYLDKPHGWIFGHLGYDLKQETSGIPSVHPDHLGFPDLLFFEPLVLIFLSPDQMEIQAENPEKVYRELNNQVPDPARKPASSPSVSARFPKEEYIAMIKTLKAHILRGDCYEINFCLEFFAENTTIDPFQVYNDLSVLSPNPFSALYRAGDSWLICASPERFLSKTGDLLLSQPMKGTAPRHIQDPETDEASRKALSESAKDRSENVMVVDLVRNDLSRICTEGSVQVNELFGVYSFPQVHQMISTVSGRVKPGVTIPAIFRATFPMGSMTGAPKKRVMELIEKYEKSRRGIFSGSLGYITPEDDFDFNVVIRSVMYNQRTGYLSYQAGSGITWYSNPEAEWEECLVKAEAIRKVLGNQ